MYGAVDEASGKNNWLPVLIAVIAAALAIAGYVLAARGADRAGAESRPSWTDVTPSQLNDMLRRKDFLLVNVHVPYDGELPQTDLFVPFDAVRESLSRFPSDRDAPIVLYCRSGRMSSSAADTLAALGYRRVYNLQGGFEAWRQAGYAVVIRAP